MRQGIKESHPLEGTKDGIICQKPRGLKSFLQASVWGNSNYKILGVQKDAEEDSRRVRAPKSTSLPPDHRPSCMQSSGLLSYGVWVTSGYRYNHRNHSLQGHDTVTHKKGSKRVGHPGAAYFSLKNRTPNCRDLEKSNPADFQTPLWPSQRRCRRERTSAFQPALMVTDALRVPCCSNLVLPSGKTAIIPLNTKNFLDCSLSSL